MNDLVCDFLAEALADRVNRRVPETYGDPLLDRLFRYVQQAAIPQFDFTDRHGRPSKRNLLSWIRSRLDGRRMNREKRFGFACFAVGFSYRRDLHDRIYAILDHHEIVDAVEDMESVPGQRQQWKHQLDEHYNQYELRRSGKQPELLDHYGYELWSHAIVFDDHGIGHHHLTTSIINLQQRPLHLIAPPIFVDSPCEPESLRPWATCEAHDVHVTVAEWNGVSGALHIAFDPLPGYGRTKIEWGYQAPNLFAPGPEYYQFGVDNPIFEIVGKVCVSSRWRIRSPQTPDGLTWSDHRNISWRTWFPKHAAYRVAFELIDCFPEQ